MEEARRFLRYVTPGLASAIEVAIYLLISAPDKMNNLVSQFTNVGTAFTLFIGSGGLGFLLGTIYYCVVEIPGLSNLKIDHRPLIANARANKWLILKNSADDSAVAPESPISQDGAWLIATALWHERIETSERIKGASKRTDNLADIMHGLGTAWVGSFAAFFAWIAIHWHLEKSLPSPHYWILPLLVVVILYVNFTNVIRRTDSVISKILLHELQDKGSQETVIMYIDSRDLDC